MREPDLIRSLTFAVLSLSAAGSAAQEQPSAEELARKAQDPLADVRAIMTDNTFSFGTSEDDTAYGFQIQPVYSIPTDKGYNWIARGIFPIVGAPAGAELPRLGDEPISGQGTEWGLSDAILQLFWTPKSERDLKWGIGPQVSLRTRTSEPVGGPGWGGGISGVVFGFAGDCREGKASWSRRATRLRPSSATMLFMPGTPTYFFASRQPHNHGDTTS